MRGGMVGWGWGFYVHDELDEGAEPHELPSERRDGRHVLRAVEPGGEGGVGLGGDGRECMANVRINEQHKLLS